jgi:hypothetical protein
MKTAMQKIKEKFMEAGALADWMDDAFDEVIEKEKQQISDAYGRGYADGYMHNDNERNIYYTKTYTNEPNNSNLQPLKK